MTIAAAPWIASSLPRSAGLALSVAIVSVHLLATAVQIGREPSGDEVRYLEYARNLTQGFYADPVEQSLRNGPAYPILLAPVVAFDLPLALPRWLNAVFTLLGLAYMLRLLRAFVPESLAWWGTSLLAFYPPLLFWEGRLYTEALAFFLVCGFLCHAVLGMTLSEGRLRQALLAGLHLGVLALTKSIFGYVMIVWVVLGAGHTLLTRRGVPELKTALLIAGLGMALCVPYLAYTQNLTGKFFLWGTQGGEGLYWMSSPHPGESGSWFNPNHGVHDERLWAVHGETLSQLPAMTPMGRSEFLWAKGMEQLKAHPEGYLGNLPPNITRLFFNTPFTYREQSMRDLGYALPNFLILCGAALALYLMFRQRFRVPSAVLYPTFFVVAYCSLMVVLGAYARFFIMAVPMIVFVTAYSIAHYLRIEFRGDPGA